MTELHFLSHKHIEDFVSKEFCDEFIEVSKKHNFEPANYKHNSQSSVAKTVVDDPECLYYLNWIDTKARQANKFYWNFILDGTTHHRFSNYDIGQGFDWHHDMIINEDIGNNSFRKLSVTVLLDDGFTGGEYYIDTAFNTQAERGKVHIPLKKGDAIVHPSFIPHMIAPVTAGNRKTMVAIYGGTQGFR